MASFLQLGNDLYTGERSFNFVGRRKLWVGIGVLLMLISIAIPFLRGGVELGIEFTGGSEFTVSGSATPDQALGTEVAEQYSDTPPRVTVLGDGSVRVQTDVLTDEQNAQLRQELADTFGVDVTNVAVSTIGPSWGADITRQMLIGLGIFVVLAAALMALYFRTWKMALAAFASLVQDLVITVGVYAATGVEVTPATVIGFLTILGYSLYDTVVVFDKIRENTREHLPDGTRTFGELVNLAINQTLVRSVNTSVVALLPVAGILFIGAFLMGAGTLRDISLALFIGIFVGALSTIFIAGPVYAWLRMGEPGIRRIDASIRRNRGEDVEVPEADEKPKRTRKRKPVAGDPDAEREQRASVDADDPWELEGVDDDDESKIDAVADDDDDLLDDVDDESDDDLEDEDLDDTNDLDEDDADETDASEKPASAKNRQPQRAGAGARSTQRQQPRKRSKRRR